MMKSPKICYVHIPKTAGTSMRKFLESNIDTVCAGAQKIKNNRGGLDAFSLLSGHLSIYEFKELLGTVCEEWDFITTFREPYSHVVSHLCWVRKAVDKGQESRLESDPKPFVRIAKKMLEYDFSHVNELSEFIEWMERENLYFFHDTQTRFLLPDTVGRVITKEESDTAIASLDQFKYIGVTDNLDVFFQKLADNYGWIREPTQEKSNANSERYGLNLGDSDIRDALAPLLRYDCRLYECANLSVQAAA